MTFAEIRAMPQTCSAVHESVFRAFHIVQTVKEELRRGCPADTLLTIIEDLETAPDIAYTGTHNANPSQDPPTDRQR